MKITHVTGDVVDTDKMNDIDAAISEKIEELRILCNNANRVFLSFVDVNRKNPKQPLVSFWNIKTAENPTDEQINDAYNSILHSIHSYLQISSGGRLGIMQIPRDEDNEATDSIET